jgi:hypothetical protein
VLGVFVTLLTLVAVVLVGLSEASDPEQARMQDLTEWEKALVSRERAKNADVDTDRG